MIETINEQHKHFISEIKELSLLRETHPSLLSSRIEASLYDDCESSLHLESNFISDAPLIHLKEVFDPPMTSLTFVCSIHY